MPGKTMVLAHHAASISRAELSSACGVWRADMGLALEQPASTSRPWCGRLCGAVCGTHRKPRVSQKEALSPRTQPSRPDSSLGWGPGSWLTRQAAHWWSKQGKAGLVEAHTGPCLRRHLLCGGKTQSPGLGA